MIAKLAKKLMSNTIFFLARSGSRADIESLQGGLSPAAGNAS